MNWKELIETKKVQLLVALLLVLVLVLASLVRACGGPADLSVQEKPVDEDAPLPSRGLYRAGFGYSFGCVHRISGIFRPVRRAYAKYCPVFNL